jgi:hypothetical protein
MQSSVFSVVQEDSAAPPVSEKLSLLFSPSHRISVFRFQHRFS